MKDFIMGFIWFLIIVTPINLIFGVQPWYVNVLSYFGVMMFLGFIMPKRY